MTDPKEPNTGHDYDGIEELDNRLPNWWLGLLYGTIIFAAAYYLYYTVGDGPSLATEYERAHARSVYAAYERKAAKPMMGDVDLLALAKDPAVRRQGQAIFQSKCIACHGAAGQGVIGPNLTDDYWLHGGRPSEIAQSITNGVPDKGMPPWGGLLKEDEIHALVAFIRSIHGTNPAGAKAPQGVLVKPD